MLKMEGVQSSIRMGFSFKEELDMRQKLIESDLVDVVLGLYQPLLQLLNGIMCCHLSKQ